jgi:hypothetical protein
MKKAVFVLTLLAAGAVCFAQLRGNMASYGGSALFNETNRINGPQTVHDSASVSLGVYDKLFFPALAIISPPQSTAALARINGSFDFIGLSLYSPTGDAPAEAKTVFDAAFIRTRGFAPYTGVGIKL